MNDYTIVKKYKILILTINNAHFDVSKAWKDLKANFDERVNKVLFPAKPSVFNSVSLIELLQKIRDNSKIIKVIFDAEISRIDIAKIEEFRTILANKDFDIEIYIDSKDEHYLYYQNQKISINDFSTFIKRMHELKINVEIMTTLGNPNNSAANYVSTGADLANYAANNGISEFVISPFIFKKDEVIPNYIPLTHRDIIEVLDSIKIDYLEFISLTGYAPEYVTDGHLYNFPKCDAEDILAIKEFYDKFMVSRNNHERKSYITDIKKIINKGR